METSGVSDYMKLNEIIEKMWDYTPIEPKKSREAAVLCLLTEQNGEACVIFEVRSRTLSHQPGEICFPGGGIEENELPLDCALRETREELGFSTDSVRVITPLDPIVHSSGQRVFPFLGWVDSLEPLSPQTEEVEEVFTVPLRWFLEHPPKKTVYTMAPVPSACPEELAAFLPHYQRQRPTVIWVWEDKVIWGMTAKILLRLMELLS